MGNLSLRGYRSGFAKPENIKYGLAWMDSYDHCWPMWGTADLSISQRKDHGAHLSNFARNVLILKCVMGKATLLSSD